MSKHQPIPWQTSLVTDAWEAVISHKAVEIVTKDDRTALATVWHGLPVRDREPLAHAIAALPDLVSVCEAAVEMLGHQGKFWKDPILARLVLDIERALNKAKGAPDDG